MTILITGSTGKTSIRIAQQLQALNVPFLVASRRDNIGFPTTKFDWYDSESFTNPFDDTSSTSPINTIYLSPPLTMEPAPIVNSFIDFSITRGVKKFVLCAGTSAVKGGQFVGKVWEHLEELKADGVEFAILRPTWFMENFSEMQHQFTIKNESLFYSAAEDAKIPFVSCDDIAAAAVAFLSGKVPYGNKDYMILGPDLLTHNQVASILSSTLGRPIKHEHKSMEEMVEQYKSVGMNDLYANFMPYLEITAKGGSEAAFENDLSGLTGRTGINLKDWAVREAKKGFWS
jgi:ergot alkaloid biosynthesis protein